MTMTDIRNRAAQRITWESLYSAQHGVRCHGRSAWAYAYRIVRIVRLPRSVKGIRVKRPT